MIFILFFIGSLLCDSGSVALKQLGESRSTDNTLTWSVTNPQTNTTCIIFNGILDFLVEYDTVDGETDFATISLPASTTATGSCDHNIQILTLNWGTPANNATFVFVRNSSGGDDTSIFTGYYLLRSVSGEIFFNAIQFPNAANPANMYAFHAESELGFMSAPMQLSYFCRSNQYILFNNTAVMLKLSHVQSEAFNDDSVEGDNTEFGPRSYCSADSLSMVITVLAYICILSFIGMTIMYIVQRRYKRAGYTRHM